MKFNQNSILNASPFQTYLIGGAAGPRISTNSVELSQVRFGFRTSTRPRRKRSSSFHSTMRNSDPLGDGIPTAPSALESKGRQPGASRQV